MSNKKWYIFTFGYGQEHAGHYVRLYGTYSETRQKMFEMFGDKWAFQYEEQDWLESTKRLPFYLREKEMVIDNG